MGVFILKETIMIDKKELVKNVVSSELNTTIRKLQFQLRHKLLQSIQETESRTYLEVEMLQLLLDLNKFTDNHDN